MNQKDFSISAILHQPPTFSGRSGMYPLVEALGAQPVFYEDTYKRVMKRSWTLGQWMRLFGNRYYGSTWNSLFPWLDEWRLAKSMQKHVAVAHFLWGEFAGPAHPQWFRKKAGILVGTFHASATRLPSVLTAARTLSSYDGITLMSESQRPFFSERGWPDDRMGVILHGVDTDYFRPAPREEDLRERPLHGLLVGKTERDHAFMAEVLRALPEGVLKLTILTAHDQKILNYENVPHAFFPQFVSDQELLRLYQQCDLLVMPMRDCAANNVLLESMSCGTPVMVNRVGGVPEYVDSTCNDVIDGRSVDAWVDRLLYWRVHRDRLEALRPAVRRWAEPFDWRRIAPRYHDFYRQQIGN